MISVRVGSATDVGRVRSLNEDSMLVGADFFVVADGMGGHAAGDTASAMAVQRLAGLSGRRELGPADVQAALVAANDEILALAQADRQRAGMGTTVAGLGLIRFAGSEHWVVFNIGDSRVYRFLDGSLVRLTADHSEVEEMVQAGTIAPDDARTHPHRNVITRALGMDPAPEADVWVFPPAPGERFLLCSDGLTSELTDPEIAAVLETMPAPQDGADLLVRRALDAGGHDNVTVILVDHVAIGLEENVDTVGRGS
jgi:serine/threonine protein phosphatase PrpC